MESQINTEIITLMSRLRSYINETRQKYLLIQNLLTFDQLIACLDCIEDTEEAIIKYKRIAIEEYDYLSLYGILQALFLQQDALKHLNKSLLNESINLQIEYPALVAIRKIRNLTSGHPTENKHKTFNQIMRTSMRKSGYTLVSRNYDSSSTSQDINLLEIIQTQKECIEEHLLKIIFKMENKLKQHKLKFLGKPLMNEIPNSLDYYISKLSEGLEYDPSNLSIARVNCELLLEVLEKIKNGMIERYESLDAIISYKYLHAEILFSLTKLIKLLNPQGHCADEINVYTTFIKIKFHELIDYIKEVDRTFN